MQAALQRISYRHWLSHSPSLRSLRSLRSLCAFVSPAIVPIWLPSVTITLAVVYALLLPLPLPLPLSLSLSQCPRLQLVAPRRRRSHDFTDAASSDKHSEFIINSVCRMDYANLDVLSAKVAVCALATVNTISLPIVTEFPLNSSNKYY